MKRVILPFALLYSLLALPLPATAATLTRTFVSSAGNDANPCTIAQPCATFARAYGLTAASGIIAALDPGKYGPLNITGPITVNGNGWAAITAPAAGSGITIHAGRYDVIQLIGLEIDGAGAAYNGIYLTQAGQLSVSNCTVTNMGRDNANALTTGNGIFMQPVAGFFDFNIFNSTIANSPTGIAYDGANSSVATTHGVIDHDQVNKNIIGIQITESSGESTGITISNSMVSNSGDNGIYVKATSETRVVMDDIVVTNNVTGIAVEGSPYVILGRSTVSNNSGGVGNATAPNNTFFTYGNNQIRLNTVSDVSGPLNTQFGLQ